MTGFGGYDVFIALVGGAVMGVVIVVATNSRLRSSNAGVFQALQQSMGTLNNVCLFIMGGLPVLYVVARHAEGRADRP
jgi:hypothetical protein